MVISMDKGAHEIRSLQNKQEPDMETHGSMSFLVNYHAFGSYCNKQGGLVYFPTSSNNAIEVACLLFLEDSESYTQTTKAYQRYVNEYGPVSYTHLTLPTICSV